MKSCTESVADNLEDVAAIRLDCLLQEVMVLLNRGLHGAGVLLPELGAPLDISKQESDSTNRQIIHYLILTQSEHNSIEKGKTGGLPNIAVNLKS